MPTYSDQQADPLPVKVKVLPPEIIDPGGTVSLLLAVVWEQTAGKVEHNNNNKNNNKHFLSFLNIYDKTHHLAFTTNYQYYSANKRQQADYRSAATRHANVVRCVSNTPTNVRREMQTTYCSITSVGGNALQSYKLQ